MDFRKSVIQIALPVTLQSLIQASFGVVDQIMTGQLGDVNVAAIGLGSKFASMFTVVAAAVSAAAGILFAQYIGSGDRNGVSRMFALNTGAISLIAVTFQAVSLAFPVGIMSLYSEDGATAAIAGRYLLIVAIGFLPQALSLVMSALFRCQGSAAFPLCASMLAAGVNTALNYLLIFGKMGAPKMGADGAAAATSASRFVEFAILAAFLLIKIARGQFSLRFSRRGSGGEWRLFLGILMPLLATEFFWSLGENVYAMIYGRVGTDACAAMTLTNPIQSVMIGAMTGLSSASGIIIGRLLGEGRHEAAYTDSKKFIKYGLLGSAALSAVLLLTRDLYTGIFNVSADVRGLTSLVLIAYAVIAPVKVSNMILGGGIVRSGGKTQYMMAVDILGTWAIGVPLGLLSAFVLHLPIYAVYFILSLEECVRFAVTLMIFKSRKWMETLAK